MDQPPNMIGTTRHTAEEQDRIEHEAHHVRVGPRRHVGPRGGGLEGETFKDGVGGGPKKEDDGRYKTTPSRLQHDEGKDENIRTDDGEIEDGQDHVYSQIISSYILLTLARRPVRPVGRHE